MEIPVDGGDRRKVLDLAGTDVHVPLLGDLEGDVVTDAGDSHGIRCCCSLDGVLHAADDSLTAVQIEDGDGCIGLILEPCGDVHARTRRSAVGDKLIEDVVCNEGDGAVLVTRDDDLVEFGR